MSDIHESTVTLKASDGFELSAFTAKPASPAKGGVVAMQEIFGVTENMKTFCRWLASNGYYAISPALFDRAERDLVVAYSDAPKGRETMQSLDPEKVLLDVAASIEYVKTGSGVSVMGFCWGGGLVYKAACQLPVKSGISYYGTRLGDMLGQTPKAPLMFHFGETDAQTPPELVEKLKEKVPDAIIHIYKAGHGFANEDRPASFAADATKKANERTLAFLAEQHGV